MNPLWHFGVSGWSPGVPKHPNSGTGPFLKSGFQPLLALGMGRAG